MFDLRGLKRFSVAALLLLGTAGAAGLGTADDDALGTYLVDQEGISVYVYLPDEAGPPSCIDNCAAYWPGLAVEDGLEAEEGVDEALLGTVDNPGGFVQATYAGWPLYQFAHDRSPGDTRGQGSTGQWFLLSPEGVPLGAEEAAAEESPAAEDVAEEAAPEQSAEVAALMDEGASVYRRVCSACHGNAGQGGVGVNLVGNPRLADAEHIADAVSNGLVYMPPQKGNMNAEETQAVLTYVRNAWGNDFGSVSLEMVREVRGE